LYDRYREDREQIAVELADKRGAALVPPFDHPDVIAGQGTVGLELVAAAQSRQLSLSAVYVPCGGGGLVAGASLAVKAAFPECSIYAVEPEGYDDTARSLDSGMRQVVKTFPATLCDALMATTPGAIAFAINKQLLSAVHTVTDAEVLRAMAFSANHLKLVAEPSGAAALAAALQRSHGPSESVGLVLSGGNVDPGLLVQALGKYHDI
jgi:threonine dehydratase